MVRPVPDFIVTWQMTGVLRMIAADELDVQTQVDGMAERDLVAASKIERTQVISTMGG